MLRRQETDLEKCRDGRSALVTPEEVGAWESDLDALIMSVSHCWETREHPDPCGHQLRLVASCTALYHAAYGIPVWIFYDYVSLFQYMRDSQQSARYQQAMDDMQLFYAHEMTYTLRVESLTPEPEWQQNLDKRVAVYWEPSHSVRSLPLRSLLRHSPPYRARGWTQAELEFSSCRSQTSRNQQIDVSAAETGKRDLKGKIPMLPRDFEATMQDLIFTWRSADLHRVLQMQVEEVDKSSVGQ